LKQSKKRHVKDDAALASILGSPHRKTPRQSGALLRLLGKMDGRGLAEFSDGPRLMAISPN